jgi:hypothetical protein
VAARAIGSRLLQGVVGFHWQGYVILDEGRRSVVGMSLVCCIGCSWPSKACHATFSRRQPRFLVDSARKVQKLGVEKVGRLLALTGPRKKRRHSKLHLPKPKSAQTSARQPQSDAQPERSRFRYRGTAVPHKSKSKVSMFVMSNTDGCSYQCLHLEASLVLYSCRCSCNHKWRRSSRGQQCVEIVLALSCAQALTCHQPPSCS